MQIVSMIVNLILIIAGLVGFLWTVVGIPVGIVWLVIHLLNGKKDKNLNWKKWLWVTLGGMIALILVFVLYTLFSMVSVLLGVDLSSMQIPSQ